MNEILAPTLCELAAVHAPWTVSVPFVQECSLGGSAWLYKVTPNPFSDQLSPLVTKPSVAVNASRSRHSTANFGNCPELMRGKVV